MDAQQVMGPSAKGEVAKMAPKFKFNGENTSMFKREFPIAAHFMVWLTRLTGTRIASSRARKRRRTFGASCASPLHHGGRAERDYGGQRGARVDNDEEPGADLPQD